MNKYKLIIAFVGLPASGKSYTSHHLCQYLSWLGYKIKIFNSGNYRRLLGNKVHKADFFNSKSSKPLNSSFSLSFRINLLSLKNFPAS